MEPNRPVIATSSGAPVADNQNSLTAGEYGPGLLADFHLIDKLAHFDRERIPERVVHAKGAGAHGYFEVTHDITRYCKAKLFSDIGKKTPIFLRFSTVGGEKGSADSARDPRGFAVKFYTEEGIWDCVGNNTPVFFIRDAIKFPDFIHTQKRNPQTNLPDPNMFWDFLSLTPESIHQVTILFSDRGTPATYRHMNGYGSHTFRLRNGQGETFFVKFHFKTNQGIKNLTRSEAAALASSDPDHATRDLFDSIKRQDFPSWNLYFQVMPEKEAVNYKWNVLDVTKVWPHSDYPLIPVGRIVLNRNPLNYFQDVEQVAFSPGHFVPGIEASEDKMLQGRLFSYPDTHRHRLGPNYDQIPINAPKNISTNVYHDNGRLIDLDNNKPVLFCPYHVRDGPMCVNGNKGNLPNYEPNSVPKTPLENHAYDISIPIQNQSVGKTFKQISYNNNDYLQAQALYAQVMNETDRQHLIDNIVHHLHKADESIRKRQIDVFYKVDMDYGKRVEEGILNLLCSNNVDEHKIAKY